MIERDNNFYMDFEDTGMFGGYGGGIASLPTAPAPEYDLMQQGVNEDGTPTLIQVPKSAAGNAGYTSLPPTPAYTPQPAPIERAPIAPPVEPAPIGASVPAMAQPEVQNTGVFGLPSLAQTQQAQPAQPAQPVQPVGPAPEIVSSLSQQILGQGLTGKWSGEGYGSAEKNAEDMAKILAGIGITDIKQFGKITRPVESYVGTDDLGNAIYETRNEETFGNKLTGQAVPNTYSERQKGNFFGGTFSGKGNTGYGVQFDSQGNPIFYTQGASSNDLANIMKDLGPIGQIAIAAATGGLSLPAQLAANAGIQLLAGGNLEDIAKGTALSYLGGQAGNLISGSSGITDLLGKTGSDIAARTAQQFVGSGGKADLEQMLLGNAVSSGINSTISDIPGLDNLSPVDRNMTSNLIAAVATGTPIEQAIQNALVGRASYEVGSSVGQARNASSTEQPQTYEDLMAGIEPKTANQPSTSPSNDEILSMINYDPNLINKSVEDTLGTKNAAEPATGKGKAMDEIDYSQIFGDYGINLADELANAGSSGNASSIFSGDGGIDLSAFASNAGDEDQAAPPPGTADLLNGIIYTDTGDPTSMMEKYYQRGIKYDLDESNLGNLSPDELERYNRMKSGDTSQYDEMAEYLRARPQDFGGADVTQYLDEFNKNFNPAGGFGSQWQTVGTNRVMINDDGTATVLNPTTKESSFLDEDQVKALIRNGTLNSSRSGYVGATGGKGSTPGGSRSAASTAKKSTTAAGGKDNTGLIMALMAMMAMMNSKGGGSSAASTIPALSANRTQLPYGSSGGAGAARPGAGGINYFSPMTYTPKAAGGGLMSLAGGGMSNLGGYSDGGSLLKGPGDGVSDSIPATIGGKQPARLAEGEFVVPARIVSELGNGSTEAGAKKLYAMMDRVQKARRKTKNVAADTKAHKYLPA